MSGAKSRNKGARAERELVLMLRDNLGVEANRNYKQVAQAQHGDIEQLIGPYLIEAKNHAKLNLKAWWQQTIAAADKRGAIPCLAYKITRAGWRFVVPLEQAWGSGHQWGRDLQYTRTLYPEGFYLIVREHL